MSDEQQSGESQHHAPLLQAAVEAVRAEVLPADAVQRVTARVKSLEAADGVDVSQGMSHRPRWNVGPAVISSLAAAAVVAVVVLGLVSLSDWRGERAFAEVIDKVKAARSVRLVTTTQFGRRPPVEGVMLLQGNRVRLEQFDGMLIQIADLDRRQALVLDTHRKLAQSLEVDSNLADLMNHPVEKLRRAKPEDAEVLGEEYLRGRRTRLYRLRHVDLLGMRGDGEMLVWVDVESELPAEIMLRDPDPKAETELRFKQFVWNEPFDERLFSLEVPEGFEPGVIVTTPSGEVDRDAEPPGEAPDLAAGILSDDRVPARIVWDPQGETITALLRDAEAVALERRSDNELRQWDVDTGRLRWAHEVGGASWVAASDDGRWLATVVGREVQLRDAASGEVVRHWASDERLTPLAFSPDGKTLAGGITEWGPFGGRGGEPSGGVELWDVEGGRLVRSIADDKPTTFLRYSADGQHVATSSNEGPVKLWEAASGELVRVFPGRGPIDVSPDGTLLACVAAGPREDKTVGIVEVYRLADGELIHRLTSVPAESRSSLLWVEYSPDGKRLVASDWNGTVSLWDAQGEPVRTWRAEPHNEKAVGVHTAVFSPDGSLLATGGEDRTLIIRRLDEE